MPVVFYTGTADDGEIRWNRYRHGQKTYKLIHVTYLTRLCTDVYIYIYSTLYILYGRKGDGISFDAVGRAMIPTKRFKREKTSARRNFEPISTCPCVRV